MVGDCVLYVNSLDFEICFLKIFTLLTKDFSSTYVSSFLFFGLALWNLFFKLDFSVLEIAKRVSFIHSWDELEGKDSVFLNLIQSNLFCWRKCFNVSKVEMFGLKCSNTRAFNFIALIFVRGRLYGLRFFEKYKSESVSVQCLALKKEFLILSTALIANMRNN